MNYLELSYGYNEKQSKNNQYVNIGDYIQTIAVDLIYKEMGILDNQVFTIDRTELVEKNCISGILPMQGWFGYIKGIEIFPLPLNIHPVFFGYHSISKKRYSSVCIETYKENEPICCRDEKTYKLMRKNGVEAYLTGCLTLTLPKRTVVPLNGKVFLVDAPVGIEKYIPSSLKHNIEYITHEFKISSSNYAEDSKLQAIKLLNKYRNEASLIVTSRLHCASPCVAMGIPVILAREYFDYRYAWIDKLIPLYTPERFNEIDWNPSSIDIEEIKKHQKKAFSLMVMNDKEKANKHIQWLHNYFMNRSRSKYKVPLKLRGYEWMRENNPKVADFLREELLQKFSVATARKNS